MRKAIILIVLIFLIPTVTALNDINISMSSGSVTICLSEKELQNQTCNSTVPLTLDGGKDHMLYLTPQYQVKHSDSTKENMKNYVFYIIKTPVTMFYSVIFLAFILMIGVYVAKTILSYVKRNSNI